MPEHRAACAQGRRFGSALLPRVTRLTDRLPKTRPNAVPVAWAPRHAESRMTIPSQEGVHDGEASGVSRPCKRPLKAFLDRLAIGQILREEYVYEVHGPFIAAEPEPPRLRLAAWIIAKIAG